MTEKKRYDSTVARIAGNITSGMLGNSNANLRTISTQQVIEVAVLSVSLARAIVVEVERTEPEAK